MEFPVLYKSGKQRYWSIAVQDSTIIRRYGQEGGKEVVTTKTIEKGKNIGKKNETTPQQQALSEARSAWKKQKDMGYSESRDVEPILLPMLANKWNGKIDEPFAVQPKLDGVRMLIGKRNGALFAMSRTGKVVSHMDHITREVEDLLTEGDVLDGENFASDKTFEEITGLFRNVHAKDIQSIHFHVFDYFTIQNPDEPYEQRLKKLTQMFKQKKTQYVHVVPTKIVHDKSRVTPLHDEYVRQGHEGIMIRDLNAPYTVAQRSNYLLKHKTFQTEEYRLVDYEEAQGKDKGTVIWVCETKKGQRFSVRPRGTYEKRKEWYKNASNYMGAYMTVQFQNLTHDGIPRFPVGLCVRDYE